MVIVFVDVVHVPQAGRLNFFMRAMPTQPSLRGRVYRLVDVALATVAEQRNAVRFDARPHAPAAVAPLRDVEPQEGHPADVVANPAFGRVLCGSNAQCRGRSSAPRGYFDCVAPT